MNNIIKKLITISATMTSFLALICDVNLKPIKANASANIGEGIYVLESAVAPNMVADIDNRGTYDGCNLQLYNRNNTAAQAFRITSAGSGYYTIQLAMTDDKVLDVQGGVGYQGCNVAIWHSNGYNATDNQLWSFEDAGGGYYYIISKTGFYLDVSGANKTNNTNIQVWNGNKTNAQKWKLVKNYDIARAVGYALTYSDNSAGTTGTYNSEYNMYNDNSKLFKGYDCANFASQCIYYAGWVKTSQWAPVYSGEFYQFSSAKKTWVSSNELYKYLSSLGYPVESVKSNLSNIHYGDIVFTGPGWHTTICTKLSDGIPCYSAHSVWRKNFPYHYEDFKDGYVIDMSFNTRNIVKVSSQPRTNTNSNITNNTNASPINTVYSNNTSKTYTIQSSSGAKVRASAGLSGLQVGALAKGSVVTYDQTVASNGYTWYHITSVDAKAGSWGNYSGWVANV